MWTMMQVFTATCPVQPRTCMCPAEQCHQHIDWAVVQVYLDPKDRNTTEYKLDTFGSVYKRLTGKEVVFEFPAVEQA